MLCLIDPSLQDHSGRLSDNLGDVVIFRAIARCLELLFPGEEICRISSHQPLEESHYERIKAGRILFLGGSNLLSSDVLAYNQWNFTAQRSDYDSPRFQDGVLFGIGWWQYQDPPTLFTSDFYRRILSDCGLHSVRDNYTAGRLREAGIPNVVSTGCPSMWSLDGVVSDRAGGWSEDCLVTITDYYPNAPDDERFLRLVLDHFRGTVFLFPQGTGDLDYIRTLPVFIKESRRFHVLDHSLEKLEAFLDTHRVNYVGTRLHGGITALNNGVPSLILAVDNRATEMSRSFGLPVVKRSDKWAIKAWLRGMRKFPPITVPKAEILRWCAQFSSATDLSAMFQPRRVLETQKMPVHTRLARWVGL
jgi:Polysaccharide pyruvyl transferase